MSKFIRAQLFEQIVVYPLPIILYRERERDVMRFAECKKCQKKKKRIAKYPTGAYLTLDRVCIFSLVRQLISYTYNSQVAYAVAHVGTVLLLYNIYIYRFLRNRLHTIFKLLSNYTLYRNINAQDSIGSRLI